MYGTMTNVHLYAIRKHDIPENPDVSGNVNETSKPQAEEDVLTKKLELVPCCQP